MLTSRVSGTRLILCVGVAALVVTSCGDGPTAADPAQLALTTQPSTSARSGVAFAQQPVVQLRDANGANAGAVGVTVTVRIAGGDGSLGGSTTVETNASGEAVFTNLVISGLVGSRTLEFTSTGLTGATSDPIELTPGPPSQLFLATPPATSAPSGVVLAPVPVIQVRDASGNDVGQSGIAVTTTIASGGGTLTGSTTASTNTAGQASFDGLAISGTIGSRTLQFTSAGLTPATSAGIDLTPGAPSQLLIATQPPSTSPSGTVFAQQPVVQLRDASGNNATQAGIVVVASIVNGGGVLEGTTSVQTTGTGQAIFTDLLIRGTIGPRVLEFGSTGLTAAQSGPIGLTLDATAQLVIVTQPANAAASGIALTQQPIVQLRDAGGSSISQSGVPIVVAIASGGGTLTGLTSVQTDLDGKAVFTNLVISGTVGPRTVRFSSSGLTPVTSGTIDVAAGPATQVVITTEPSSTGQSGAVLAQQPVVQIRDASNNNVSQNGIPVTAGLATGSGTLGGDLTIETNSNGQVSFTNLMITGTAGPRTLRYTSPGLTPDTSTTVTISVPTDLAVDGAYLTQGVQNYAGSVPLISGRDAFVRVFGRADQANAMSAAARVRVYVNGVLTNTYDIPAPAASVPTTIDENDVTRSWNLSIPGSAIQAGLSMLVDLDPTNTVPELNKANNTFPSSGTPMPLDVRAAPTFNVTFVPVLQQPNGLIGDVTVSNVASYTAFARRVYPLANVNTLVRTTYTFTGVLASSYDAEWSRLLSEMLALRASEGSTRYYYGVLKPSYSFGGTGFGYIGSPAAVGVDWTTAVQPSTSLRSLTAAHEWGHNFGRLHVNCGAPANPDPSYPYGGGFIGLSGFDVSLGTLRSPSTYFDLMSYCEPYWISDYTYNAVRSFRELNGTAPMAAVAPERVLLVWGRIGPQGIVLEPAFEITAPPSLPSGTGPHRIQLVDQAGQSIIDLSFRGESVDHFAGEEHFAFALPVPVNAPAVAELRLSASGRQATRRRPDIAGGPTTGGDIRSQRVDGKVRLEWDPTRYPVALIRDAATGEILSFARQGRVDVQPRGQELDVVLSDGVGSVARRIRISP